MTRKTWPAGGLTNWRRRLGIMPGEPAEIASPVASSGQGRAANARSGRQQEAVPQVIRLPCSARILVCAAIACMSGPAAHAHAFLDRASPAVGSEVSGSPPMVALTYSEPVEPLFSTIQVTDTGGARVDLGPPAVQNDSRTLMVRLKSLSPGDYAVAWRVTSVDTHKTEGHFSFTVRP